jgi:DNA-binding transcriptional MerR regulator
VTFSKNGSAGKGSRGVGGDGIRAQKSSQPRKRLLARNSGQSSGAERALKIGEAAGLVGVEPYVLRFWETQFSCIRPKQSRSRHRYYTQSDIETLRCVKHLLHTEGYTIAGARRFIREKGFNGIKVPFTAKPLAASGRRTKERLRAPMAASSANASVVSTRNVVGRVLREIREDLRALHRLLDNH